MSFYEFHVIMPTDMVAIDEVTVYPSADISSPEAVLVRPWIEASAPLSCGWQAVTATQTKKSKEDMMTLLGLKEMNVPHRWI